MTIRDAFEIAGFACLAPEEVVRPMPGHRVSERIHNRHESDFSRMHANLSGPHQCWICLFPIADRAQHSDLWKSVDHVIPRAQGGLSTTDNLRVAHRYCNAKRKTLQVDAGIVRDCRRHIVEFHPIWLVSSSFDRSTGLRIDIYDTPPNASNHKRAFECRSGAD